MNVKKLYIDYFKTKGHKHYPSSPLIPNNDKSLLFVNSGMVQFKDIFLGNIKPKDKAIVTCQKCMRAGGKHNDLDNIGFTSRHHSFFEMLGNFSFGEYFKDEAISFAWDFLTNVLKFDEKRLYVSVHDSDSESKQIWAEKIKIDPDRILVLGDEDNFWQMGETGPCGPCTEIYYDQGDGFDGVLPTVGDPKDRYIEIWNLVFTQYNKTSSGEMEELPQKCVDTGMGLERVQAIVEGFTDNYDSTIFQNLSQYIDSKISLNNDNLYIKKILLDHIRACCHLINDNVIPDREGRGYVLRRILRRSSRFVYKNNIKDPFLYQCAEVICTSSKDFPELKTNLAKIVDTIKSEEQKYLKTLGKGIELIDDFLKNKSYLDAETIFMLYDTYGFPFEITQEIASEKNIMIDKDGYEKLMMNQKESARNKKAFTDKVSSNLDTTHSTEFIGYDKNNIETSVVDIYHNDKKVKNVSDANVNYLVVLKETCLYPEGGGQISDVGSIHSDMCKLDVVDVQKINNTIYHQCKLVSGTLNVGDKVSSAYNEDHRKCVASNHSSTHLLHHYLRLTLGEHVQQRGSSVTEDGFRFDFTHTKPVTEKELMLIENSIQDEIHASTNTQKNILPFDKAIESGAIAFFEEKYSDNVRVVNIGKESIELCGGTHVENTSEIGAIKIINQSSVANGIRRLECVTGQNAFRFINNKLKTLEFICEELKSTDDNVIDKITGLQNEVKALKKKNVLYSKDFLTNLYKGYSGINLKDNVICFIECNDNLDSNESRLLTDIIKSNHDKSLSFLLSKFKKNITCYICVSKNIISSYNAKNLSKQLNTKFNGKGGGNDTFATVVLSDTNVDKIKTFITEIIK